MTLAAHNRPPHSTSRYHPPMGALEWIGIAGLSLTLAGCGGGDTTAATSTETVTATSTVRATAPPVSTTFEMPEQSVDELDAILIAELQERGFVGDLDEATGAGAGLCLRAKEVGLIDASAEAMDIYEYTPEQIQAVTAAALASYCPDL